jgi:two-component system nitrate/nitrite response regulator NarL
MKRGARVQMTSDAYRHGSMQRATTNLPIRPLGTVLLITKALLMRDMIGRILTDGGYVLLGDGRHDGELAFGPPLSDAAWQADFVIVVYDQDEISSDTLGRFRQAATGKMVLLLLEDGIETISYDDVLATVDGILDEEVSADALFQALSVIQRGERVVSRQLAQLFARQTVPSDRGQPRDAALLSPREREIVRRLVRGEPNKTIGHGLNITAGTVKVHLKAILRKLSVQNRTQAAIWAMNNGFDQDID